MVLPQVVWQRKEHRWRQQKLGARVVAAVLLRSRAAVHLDGRAGRTAGGNNDRQLGAHGAGAFLLRSQAARQLDGNAGGTNVTAAMAGGSDVADCPVVVNSAGAAAMAGGSGVVDCLMVVSGSVVINCR